MIAAERTIASFAETHAALVDSGMSAIRVLWFRGHADHSWLLTPRIERVSPSVSERELLHDFEVEASKFVPQRLDATWEVMTLAQHHRIPTRLLDWSTSMHVALHFAVDKDEDKDDIDGALFVLDPQSLNYESEHRRSEVFMFGRTARIADGTLDALLSSSDSMSRDECFAVMSPHNFDRISNQSGTFVAVSPSARRLDSFLRKQSFEKWIIPASAKAPIRDELKEAGYTPYRLFPTLDNAARQVRSNHGIDDGGNRNGT